MMKALKNTRHVSRIETAFLLLSGLFMAVAPVANGAFSTELTAFWDAQYNAMNWQLTDADIAKPAGADVDPYYAQKGMDKVDLIRNRTLALAKDIQNMKNGPNLSAAIQDLENFSKSGNALNDFRAIAQMRRNIALQNPLLDFDAMVFTCFESCKPQFHSQQNAWMAIPDAQAGLYKVSGIKSGNPTFTDLLASAHVSNGRYVGKTLSNKNPEWNGDACFFTPEISYDGTKIMFAWAPWAGWRGANGLGEKYDLRMKFRIFEMNLDGTNLRMLTDFLTPEMDEYDPTYLPNGRILWVSERHNGGQRCGNTATSGNMYSMKPTGGADGMGSDIVRISWHETNERSPVVDYNGKIVYSRWDYIDRHAYSAQCMFTCNPDGSNPLSYHGNYIEDDKPFHPISETDIRPIPGSPGKYAAICAGHHEAYKGPLAVIDINKRAKYQEQIRWFWPGWELPGDSYRTSPESNIKDKSRRSPYDRQFMTPYPLSEDYMIVAEENEVILVDKFRNEILLFSNKDLDGAGHGCSINIRSPLPIKSRPIEPVLATQTYQGERRAGAPKAKISIMNVYETDTPFPKGTVIKQLRICQILPRPKQPFDTYRNVWQGWSDGALLKAVIGTVPVEEDGSAYFEAPIEREIFFQLIDDTGKAVQSMLSGTCVHPGETLACIGCHEDKWKKYPQTKAPIAMRRAPSTITPSYSGTYPLTYDRLAKPVFVNRCVGCHKTQNVPLDFEYWDTSVSSDNGTGCNGPAAGNLYKYVRFYHAAYENAYGIANSDLTQMYLGFPGTARSRSIPGQIGANACPLIKNLDGSHHGVSLSKEEKERIYIWLDLNAQDLGIYDWLGDYGTDWSVNGLFNNDIYLRQHNGEVVWPTWGPPSATGMDPANPTGIQTD